MTVIARNRKQDLLFPSQGQGFTQLPGVHSCPSGRIVLDLCPGGLHCPCDLSVGHLNNGCNADSVLVLCWP